jgi:hypothetical protein
VNVPPALVEEDRLARLRNLLAAGSSSAGATPKPGTTRWRATVVAVLMHRQPTASIGEPMVGTRRLGMISNRTRWLGASPLRRRRASPGAGFSDVRVRARAPLDWCLRENTSFDSHTPQARWLPFHRAKLIDWTLVVSVIRLHVGGQVARVGFSTDRRLRVRRAVETREVVNAADGIPG